jgi:hypothetical protein
MRPWIFSGLDKTECKPDRYALSSSTFVIAVVVIREKQSTHGNTRIALGIDVQHSYGVEVYMQYTQGLAT